MIQQMKAKPLGLLAILSITNFTALTIYKLAGILESISQNLPQCEKITLHLIFDYTLYWYKAQIPKTGSIEQTVVYLHWKPPRSGVCKVNTDRSRINVMGISGAGDVLRDSNGAWIQGFSVNLGASSILEAELWGIFWGLRLAWDYGYRDVEIEYDSGVAVTLLTSATVSTHPLYNIISCCKMKIHDHWRCTIEHIYNEQNEVADALATRSYNLDSGLHVYDETPDFLNDILVVDARSV